MPAGARRFASAASGFIDGCLTFQLPVICSTTSLESIRTSIVGPWRMLGGELEPGDQAAVLGDVVGGDADRLSALGDQLTGVGVLEQRAVRSRARIAAGGTVGLDDHGPVRSCRGQRPDSPVRTRIRLQSSQRITSSEGALADHGEVGGVQREPAATALAPAKRSRPHPGLLDAQLLVERQQVVRDIRRRS